MESGRAEGTLSLPFRESSLERLASPQTSIPIKCLNSPSHPSFHSAATILASSDSFGWLLSLHFFPHDHEKKYRTWFGTICLTLGGCPLSSRKSRLALAIFAT